MTWNEKADEISASIFNEIKSFNNENIKKALRAAAIKGMEFDSNNWCNKVR